MSRRHRPSRADRKPVTRRYVARVVQRATQEICRSIVMATGASPNEPNVEPLGPMDRPFFLESVVRGGIARKTRTDA